MKASGWGRYPVIEAEALYFETEAELRRRLAERPGFIPHGLGRSYGDSALAERLLISSRFDAILDFDEETGVLTCEAGVSLAEIIDVFLPRGWFLEITPGTKFVTVGGAIASDVHGKNHHTAGCFSECVLHLELMLPDGKIVRCSKEENGQLFRAVCGGMGLTGVIVRAAIRLKRVESAYIAERRFRAANLKEIFDLFEEHSAAPYSVAWLDCLARGEDLGRSVLIIGDHLTDGRLEQPKEKAKSVPFDLPGFVLNRWSVAAFNSLLYLNNRRPQPRLVHVNEFFYPLDAIHHWNRMYGKKGFVQYQFVLPKAASLEGLTAVLSRVSAERLGSFLVVLKLMGPANDNLLSFPLEGYTLALDFKIQPGLFRLMDELDRLVIDHGGRIYLTKDARMSPEAFRRGYPDWARFAALRDALGLKGAIDSLQSKRLGI